LADKKRTFELVVGPANVRKGRSQRSGQVQCQQEAPAIEMRHGLPEEVKRDHIADQVHQITLAERAGHQRPHAALPAQQASACLLRATKHVVRRCTRSHPPTSEPAGTGPHALPWLLGASATGCSQQHLRPAALRHGPAVSTHGLAKLAGLLRPVKSRQGLPYSTWSGCSCLNQRTTGLRGLRATGKTSMVCATPKGLQRERSYASLSRGRACFFTQGIASLGFKQSRVHLACTRKHSL